MNTRDRIRERRQERMKRIMEHNAKGALHQLPNAQPQPQNRDQLQSGPQLGGRGQAKQAPQFPIQTDNRSMVAEKELEARSVLQQENDPERLWKASPNPWESAGWRIAPLPSKDVRAAQRGGPPPPPNGSRFIARGLFIQSVLAAAVFVIVFFMFKVDLPAAKKGQEAVTAALTENMNFDAAAATYRKWFAGAPSFIPFFGSHGNGESRLAAGSVELPVISPLPDGTVVHSFAETLGGVEIAGRPEQAVLAAETGRVILVSQDGDNGETVVVQHANARMTVYGHLEKVVVAANDWVEAGKTLGKLAVAKSGNDGQSLLFFAVKEKGRYVNPADVVPID